LAIGVVGWVVAVIWELRAKAPVIDFRLLKNRNFAIASVLFFVFGFGLFGSTTLIPQLLQSLYGYRAIDAGLVLGPGALLITLLAPLSAQLLERKIASSRPMLVLSLCIGATAMWYFGSFNPATDYRHFLGARMLQGLGYGFFFVPVNVIAYSQLTPDQNNKASSLTNLFRNWGGSFGIAYITTGLARREQFHQSNLGAALTGTSIPLNDRIAATTHYFVQKGFTEPDALAHAQGWAYQQLQHQVRFLSFMDCFHVIAWVTLAVVPLLFLLKQFKMAGKPPAAH